MAGETDARALQPTDALGLVAGVANQPLRDVARLLVGRVQAAGPDTLVADPIEEHPGVRIEGLRDRALGVCLDLVSERLVLLVAPRVRVRRVDRDLAFEARRSAERIRDRAGGDRDEDDVRIGGITALAPEQCDLVPGVFPESSEPAADGSPCRSS